MAKDDHLLSVQELAGYLQVSERTVFKMAADGTIPAVRLDNQWRFKRDVIDAWLAERMVGEQDPEEMAIEDVPDGAMVSLGDLLEERSIVNDLGASEAVGAIEALAARASANGYLLDKKWFVGAIVAREALASTAMDGGVAFLHTRQRNAAKITRPFIVFGRSHTGIDFGAPDRKPTYLFFLLGLKYDKLHLPILGRLARVLRQPEVVRTLRAAPTVERIRDTLLSHDQRALVAVRAAHAAQAAAGPTSSRPAAEGAGPSQPAKAGRKRAPAKK